jgi:hypothetical protein
VRISNNFFTRGLNGSLTTTRFTRMPTTVLSFDYLYSPVAQSKIELPVKRHFNGHIRKE